MPWPPTGMLDPFIDISEQLAAPTSPGLESADSDPVDPSTPFDVASGMMAPGVMQTMDPNFTALPSPDEELLKVPDSSKTREAVIQFALEKIGMNYVWGGESDREGGYDCSGLLFYAFKKAGIDMPRVSYTQAARGQTVKIKDLQPGDLVAWENNPDQPGADHIALYLGDGWILEAPKAGLQVRKRKLGANEGAWGVKLSY